MILKLTTAPILQGLSVNKDFFIYSDSSYFGTGFAVFQPSDDDPNILRVVGYGGNALTDAHRQWSVLQIELLGIYLSLRQYEIYCRHRLIHIFSDNLSLCYLRGMAMGSPREKRMASYIMGFRLHFSHISGKQNMLSDSLSRCFEDMTENEKTLWLPKCDVKDDFLFAIHKDERQNHQTNLHSTESSRRQLNTMGSASNYQDANQNANKDTPADIKLDQRDNTSRSNPWHEYSITYEPETGTTQEIRLQHNETVTAIKRAVEPSPLSGERLISGDASVDRTINSTLRASAPEFKPLIEQLDTSFDALTNGSPLSAQVTSDETSTLETMNSATDVWFDCCELHGEYDTPHSTQSLELTASNDRVTPAVSTSAETPLEQLHCDALCKQHSTAGDHHTLSDACKAINVHRRHTPSSIDQSAPPTTDNDNDAVHTEDMIIIPSISPTDYENDKYLSELYAFLKHNILPANDSVARQILLMSEDFYIGDDNLLYRISVPRTKKQARVQSTEIRLALPQIYLSEVVKQCHDALGHFSKERNFEFLRARYYAKNLFDCVSQYANTCDKCQRFKRDCNKKTDKLVSLPVPSGPGQTWSCDHFILTRPTVEGYTAAIIFVDAFSKWVVIRLVKSTSALDAAVAFVENVVSIFGLDPTGQLILHSDRGSAFTSNFFRAVCKLLNVRLITSGSQISTSNGAAEAAVKAAKTGLRIYADNDLHLKAAIPLIELSLRAQPSTVTKLSPFEIVMGRKIALPIIGNDSTNHNFKGDQGDYYNFLSQRLTEIHEGVKENIVAAKQKDEKSYNARHNAEPPKWVIGQEVLITDKHVKPHSEHIITRPKYNGSFYITDIVHNESFGPSYRLTRVSDGKPLKTLISGSRLRLYTASERAHFYAKYPALQGTEQRPVQRKTSSEVTSQSQLDSQITQDKGIVKASDVSISAEQNKASDYEPAIKIIRERKSNGKKDYYVLFANNEKYWADRVTPALLKQFRLNQERYRSKRRKKRH
jgi:hypothetical protein